MAATPAPAASSSVRQGLRVLVAVAIVNVGTWIFLLMSAQLLGPADFGELSAMLGLVNVVGLPLGAVQVGVARHVAEFRAQGRVDGAREISRAFLVASALLGLVLMLLYLALLVPLANVLSLNSLGAFALLSLSIPVTVLLPVVLGVLQGEQRFKEYSVSLALTGALRPGIFAVLVLYGFRLGGAVVATFLSGFVAFGAAVKWARGGIASGSVRLSTLREPLIALWPIAAGLLAITALTNIDLLFAKATLSADEAGVFGAGAFIGRAILYLPLAIVAVMFPRVATRRVRGHDTLDILGRSLVVVLGMGAVFTLLLFAAPEQILRIGFGEEYVGGADELGLFGLSATLFSVLNLYVNYHLSRGESRFAFALLGLGALQIVALLVFNGSIRTILLVDIAIAVIGLVYYEAVHGGTVRALHSTTVRLRSTYSQDGENIGLGTAVGRASAARVGDAAALSRRAARRIAIPAALLVVYSALIAVITWPVVARPGSTFFGFGNDNLGGIWNFWWWSYAADHDLDPDRSPFMSAPFGFDLSALPVQPYERWLGEWLTSAFDEVVAYNIIVLASFPLAGLTMYLLANYLLRNRLAAAIAGGIFAFAPFHFGMAMNYPALSSIQWVPLYFLFLARALFERRLRDVFLAVVSFGVLALGSYYYAFQALAVTAAVLLVFGLRWRVEIGAAIRGLGGRVRTPRAAIAVGATVLAAAAIAAFLAVKPLQLYLDNRESFSRPLSEAVRYSARPWAWFVPGIDHPVVGGMLEPFYSRHLHDAPSYEQSLYLGLVPLALTILTVVTIRSRSLRIKRAVLFAGVTGAAGAIVALGPFLPLSPDYYADWASEGGSAKLPLPGYLMFEFAPTFRFFARAQVFVILAVAILSAAAIMWILRRLPPWRAGLVVCLLVMATGFEYLNAPPPRVAEIGPTPAVYEWLRDEPGSFSVAEYPMPAPAQPRSLYYQFWGRVHQKPIVNNQNDPTALSVYPVVADITNPAASAELARLGIRYAIVHTRLPALTTPPYQPILPGDALPPGLVAGYPQLRLEVRLPDAEVYRVLPEPRPTALVASQVAFGEGFFPPEGPRGTPFRWMGTTGASVAWPFAPAGTDVVLEASLQSFARARTLEVTINGRPVPAMRIGTKPRVVRIPFVIGEGPQQIRFSASPAATSPAAERLSPDARDLAIGVRGMRIVRAG